jgi:hypothetical protein
VVDKNQETKKFELFKTIVNKDVTSFKVYELDGKVRGDMAIKIVENKMIFTEDIDGVYALISQEDGYVFFDNRYVKDNTKYGLGIRGYASQSDAQAYFDSIKTEIPFKLSDLVGKTLYQHVKERSTGNIAISEITVQANGKLKIVDFGNTEFLDYRIQGDTLYVTEVNGQEKANPLLKKTDKYVKFSDGGSETSTFYFSKADAEAAPVKEIGDDNGGGNANDLKSLLAGKTFYLYFIDHDNTDTPTVSEIKFNNDATSFTDKMGNVINAQVNANVITLSYPDGGTDVMTVTSDNNKYILLYEDENDWFKLFYNEADAKATLEAEKDKGSSPI